MQGTSQSNGEAEGRPTSGAAGPETQPEGSVERSPIGWPSREKRDAAEATDSPTNGAQAADHLQSGSGWVESPTGSNGLLGAAAVPEVPTQPVPGGGVPPLPVTPEQPQWPTAESPVSSAAPDPAPQPTVPGVAPGEQWQPPSAQGWPGASGEQWQAATSEGPAQGWPGQAGAVDQQWMGDLRGSETQPAADAEQQWPAQSAQSEWPAQGQPQWPGQQQQWPAPEQQWPVQQQWPGVESQWAGQQWPAQGQQWPTPENQWPAQGQQWPVQQPPQQWPTPEQQWPAPQPGQQDASQQHAAQQPGAQQWPPQDQHWAAQQAWPVPDPNAPGVPTAGQPAYGQPDPGQPTVGQPVSGQPTSSAHPVSGQPTSGYPTSGHPTSGQPTSGHPTSGHPTSGYPTSGQPTSGYPTSGYPGSGYPAQSMSGHPVSGQPGSAEQSYYSEHQEYSGQGQPGYADSDPLTGQHWPTQPIQQLPPPEASPQSESPQSGVPQSGVPQVESPQPGLGQPVSGWPAAPASAQAGYPGAPAAGTWNAEWSTPLPADPLGQQPGAQTQPGQPGQPGPSGQPGQPGPSGQPGLSEQSPQPAAADAPPGFPDAPPPAPHDLHRPADHYSYRPAPDAAAPPGDQQPRPHPHAQQPPHPQQQPDWRTGPAQPRFDQPAVPPTAEEFAARRAHRPRPPEPTMGMPALILRVTFGTVSPQLSKREIEYRDAVAKVRRNFGGLRQVTVVNPKGGAGKTVAVLMTAMTFGQNRGGYVLAWDNNETQGTLGMRSQQDYHVHTVRDVLRALPSFQNSGKVGDLTPFVRSQGEAMFDVLASDESATAGEMLTADAFKNIREVVARFYKLIVVDTGNNVRAANWQAAIDATDQLVVTMSARGDSAETAARMLDHLDQTGRHELVRRAVTVVAMPASRKDVDLAAIQRHFAARTRAVLLAPYERLLDSGEPIRYGELSSRTRNAWLRIGAAIAEGL